MGCPGADAGDELGKGSVNTMDASQCRAWFGLFCTMIDDQKDELTRLDSAIGDADHGVNMERGAAAIRMALASENSETPGDVFELLGLAVLEGIGGAAGPLYASLLLGAAKPITGMNTIDLGWLATAMQAGVVGLAARGRAEVGDKTMYDVACPAAEALRNAAEAGATFANGVELSLAAATAGHDATVPLQARKGRAAYLGHRSVGHLDPGAASMLLLFASLAAVAGESP